MELHCLRKREKKKNNSPNYSYRERRYREVNVPREAVPTLLWSNKQNGLLVSKECMDDVRDPPVLTEMKLIWQRRLCSAGATKHRQQFAVNFCLISGTVVNNWIYFAHSNICYRVKQEGQHPLTGQRAANFTLLANQ